MIKKIPIFLVFLYSLCKTSAAYIKLKILKHAINFGSFFKEVCDFFFIDNSVKPELSLIFYFNIYKLMPLTSIGWLQKSDVCI